MNRVYSSAPRSAVTIATRGLYVSLDPFYTYNTDFWVEKKYINSQFAREMDLTVETVHDIIIIILSFKYYSMRPSKY